MKWMLPVVLLVAATLPLAALAAEFMEYPQFRYASGLPGSGFGVDPEGHIGFDGALQLVIPVGYTPGYGNFALVPSVGATDGGFPDDFSGAGVNGTLTWGFGLFDHHALWFSGMGTGKGSSTLESAYNAQVQIVREDEHWPAISVGVIDMLNMRAATRLRPFDGAARSFFVAATREMGTPERPLYVTAGIGTGRYRYPFAGVSYQPTRSLKVFAEFDSWVINAGGAWRALKYKDEWNAILTLGVVDLERIDVSLAVTKTNF